MASGASRWIVAPSDERLRLDHYLARKHQGESRSQIQLWIRSGHVLVNGKKTKTGYLLRVGDEIILERTEAPAARPSAEPIPLEILYQDEDLAVINKPSGLVCHVGAGIRSGTLVNAILHHFGAIDSPDPSRPGIVHRLDKQTSGVMVVARRLQAHRSLARQFKNRSIRKLYLALVYGTPKPPLGTIDVPIGRDPKNRKKISPRARRKRQAITHYRVVREYGPFSLLEVRIETGRTHQIRVHLAQKGHSVVGDTLYGGARYKSLMRRNLRALVESFPRMFLHSSTLDFTHPRTEEHLSFKAPLPAELESLLRSISASLFRK